MNPSSLREICAKATPGPWKANFGTVSVDSADRSRRERICSVSSPAGAAPEAWGAISSQRHVTAQLIARFSPETALAVYEALKRTERGITVENVEHGNYYRCSQCRGADGHHEPLCLTGHALRLLDGRTEP